MRTKLLLIRCLVGASFFSFASSSSAELLKGSAVFIPGIGIALPVKNFGYGAKSGFHGFGEVGYFPINNLIIGVSFAVSQNNLYERNRRSETLVDTLFRSMANRRFMQLGLNLKYVVPIHGRLRPFVQTGGAIYTIKSEVRDDITFNGFTEKFGGASDISYHFGWNYGGGFLVSVSPYISFFTSTTYHSVLISSEFRNYSAEYLAVNGGLAFFF